MHRSLLGALAVCTAAGAVAGDAQLDDAAITAAVNGKRLAAVSPAGTSYRLNFKEDGSLVGNEGHTTDNGTWRVEAGKLCIKWNKWSYDGCGKLVQVGSELKLLQPGSDEKVYLTFN